MASIPKTDNPIKLAQGGGGNFVRVGNYEHEINMLTMVANVDSGEVQLKNIHTGTTEVLSRPWYDFVDKDGNQYSDLKTIQNTWRTLNTAR